MEISFNKEFIQVKKPVTYSHYLTMIEKFALRKQTSGPEQTEEKISATSINLQRMKRILKGSAPDTGLVQAVANLETKMTWLVITEAWCGDAAQNLPIMNKIACLSNGNIELVIVFRDENPQLMDHFLTNGTRSIPKLICLNSETGEVLDTWGPRPGEIQELLNNYKAANPGVTHKEIMYQLHLNYFQDKGQSLQAELLNLVNACRASLSGAEASH